nr:DUF4167 domain-containing protein [Novosphingobium panipatense]
MNNNRGNNRRRGRGNNRQQGGQQVNRIDSRARGNAPQLLEKYRKLAHDAHLNGDRVQEEYYLQFADHYFRVIADQKQRQEESRQPRREDRGSDYGDDYAADEYGDFDSPAPERQERQERPERQERNFDRQDRQEQRQPRREDSRRDDSRREDSRREERAPRSAPVEEEAALPAPGNEAEPEGEATVYEPTENPFVRDNRASRGLKQRKPRRRRDEDEAGENADVEAPAAAEAEPVANLDPATLPPAIAAAPAKRTRAAKTAEKPAEPAAEQATGEAEAGEEKPRRRRTRKAAAADEGGESPLEAVNS